VDGDPSISSAWTKLGQAAPAEKALWQLIWVEEYRAVRTESDLARNAQQTILQWSLGSFAAVIAGSLVMLQASQYVAKCLVDQPGHALPPPIQYEHLLASSSYSKGHRLRRQKNLVGYIGTTGIYFGFSSSSILLFVNIVASHVYRLGVWTAPVRALSWAWGGAYLLIFVAVTWHFKRRADRQSRQGLLPSPELPHIELIPSVQPMNSPIPAAGLSECDPEAIPHASASPTGTGEPPNGAVTAEGTA
jgi:hypothetical protein